MMQRSGLICVFALALCAVACGEEEKGARVPFDVLSGTLGPAGGELVGESGTSLAGVVVAVAPGALSSEVSVEVSVVVDDTPLPENAFSIGDQFRVEGDAALGGVAQLTVPFDPEEMRRFVEDIHGVKVWRRSAEGWATAEVVAVEASSVSVTIDEISTYGPGVRVE